MDIKKDFFGELFDDPKGDPLLHEEAGDSPAKNQSSNAEHQGPPSWMSYDSSSNGRDANDDGRQEKENVEQKEIIIDQRGENGKSLDALNQAIRQDWDLVRVFLSQADGQPDTVRHSTLRFVATLEKQNPKSLFDFG
jgi:hypothetical protein